MPALLGCNIETNSEPTLKFYIDSLGDENKALDLIIRIPASLAYSLEKRLKPRLEEAKEAGMVVDTKFLTSMMAYTNDDWDMRLTREKGKQHRHFFLLINIHCLSVFSDT